MFIFVSLYLCVYIDMNYWRGYCHLTKVEENPVSELDYSKIDMGSGSVFEEMPAFKFSIKKSRTYFFG